MRLIKPDGIVGLLTPSGIYADKTAARFFKSVSTSGRIGGLVRFREPPPRNKITALLSPTLTPALSSPLSSSAAKGAASTETECAFFLHDTAAIHDPDRCFPLAPVDFARVNPNTGTAPVFRTRRDADITRRIYERHPILVDRSGDDENPRLACRATCVCSTWQTTLTTSELRGPA